MRRWRTALRCGSSIGSFYSPGVLGVGQGERCRRSRGALWPWLVGLNWLVFAVQDKVIGGRALLDYAVPAGDAIDDGEIWRPLTSLVVHPGGVVHIGINTVLLAAIGFSAERELGPGRALVTYVGAGYATNALRYAVGGRAGGGASAAVFALAGAAGANWLARTGRQRAGEVGATALVAGGLAIAATTNDNHALALGLGGLCGRAAAGDSPGWTFRVSLIAVTTAGTVAMLARILTA